MVVFDDISPLYSGMEHASKRNPILAAYLGQFTAYLEISNKLAFTCCIRFHYSRCDLDYISMGEVVLTRFDTSKYTLKKQHKIDIKPH